MNEYSNLTSFFDNIKNKRDKVFSLTKIQNFDDDFYNSVDQLISARSIVNKYKGVDQIEKFQRRNASMIDFQAMVSEFSLSLTLFSLYKKDAKENQKFEITSPSFAEVFLKHDKEDFSITNKTTNEKVSFDVKSQFSFNNSLNVNYKSHKRFKEHNSDFYVLTLIETPNREEYRNIKSLEFVFVGVDYFNKNSEYVDLKRANSTPYLSLSVEKIFSDFELTK